MIALLYVGGMPPYHAVPCAIVLGPLAILLGEVPVLVVVGLSVSVPVMAPFALPTLAIVVAIVVAIVIVVVVLIALGAVFELLQIEVPLPLHAVVSQGEWGRWCLARTIEPE